MEKLKEPLFKGTESTLNNIIKALLLGFLLAVLIEYAVPDDRYYYRGIHGEEIGFFTKKERNKALTDYVEDGGVWISSGDEIAHYRERNRKFAIIAGIICSAVLFLVFNKPKK